MNWVYVDKETYEVKYGVRLDAQPNLTGPFDCTRQDRRLTFDGWEGFCAVEEFPTLWALYFDKDDDGLRSKVAPGTRVLDIELTRKEKRWKKEVDLKQQDQTTKREVDINAGAPVDKPVTVEPQLSPPGVSTSEPPGPTESQNGANDASTSKPEPKPLAVPKSIFPGLNTRPWETVRPITPPPAYTAKEETPKDNSVAASAPPQPQPDHPASSMLDTHSEIQFINTTLPVSTTATGAEPAASEPTKPPVSKTTETQNLKYPEQEPAATSQTIPPALKPSSASEIVSSPPKTAATTPSVPKTPSPPPTTSPVSPLSGNRITPRLRRSSGTKTLAQAQKFETMGQKQQGITPPKPRPTSNLKNRVSSVFVQNDEKVVPKDTNGVNRPDASVLGPSAPLPLRPARSSPDSASFGAATKSTSVNTIIASNIPKSPFIRPPTSPVLARSGSLAARTGRQPLSNPPFLRRAATSSTVKKSVDSTEQNKHTRPVELVGRSIRRQNSSSTAIPSTPSPSRKRGGSMSSQGNGTGFSRIPSRPVPLRTTTAPPVAPPSKPITSKNSSSSPVSQRTRPVLPPPALPAREPSDSKLYREINEILQPKDVAANSIIPSSPENTTKRNDGGDRVPPLRRVATAKSPLRRRTGSRSPTKEDFVLAKAGKRGSNEIS